MSEQMIWAQPRVSTAVSLRMMAFLLDILVTPMDSTMVTTATRPSGMAATARETATMKVFSTREPLMVILFKKCFLTIALCKVSFRSVGVQRRPLKHGL